MIIQPLKTWPVSKAGLPIWTCTEDAIFYGRLIAKKPDLVLELIRIKKQALDEFDMLYAREKINYSHLMTISLRAQLSREALEEVRRVMGVEEVEQEN